MKATISQLRLAMITVLQPVSKPRVWQSSVYASKWLWRQRRVLKWLLCAFAVVGPASAEIITSDRRIPWDPGTRSELRERDQICSTLSPSGGDDAGAIEDAIDSCGSGQVVKLRAGTFSIRSEISWRKSDVTLRGSGKDETVLRIDSVMDDVFSFYNNMNDWQNAAIGLSSGLTKGSTEIVTSPAHGWEVGDFILIDQLNNEAGDPPFDDMGYYGECNWCSRNSGERLKAQTVRVVSVNGNTAGISPGLYQDYETDYTPQGVKYQGVVENAAVESLKIDNAAGRARRHFGLFFVFNSLFYDLELDSLRAGSQSRGFWVYGGLWNTIKQCDIHTALSDQTDQGYGIFLGLGASANLIENNVFHTLILAVAFEGSNSGNVVAYNYTMNSVWFDNANRLMMLGHGGGSTWNLIEGNFIEGRFRSDAGFGTQHHFTLLRNRIEQIQTSYGQNQVVDIEQGQHYTNLVGNVLGTVGFEEVYEHENDNQAGDDVKVVYRLGYEDPYDSGASGNDAAVRATMLRHGNWDSVNQSTVWDPMIADQSLPDSLYLTAKPDWWGSLSWPAIGPDVSPMDGMIPAKARYLGIDIEPTTIQPPRNLRIVSQQQ